MFPVYPDSIIEELNAKLLATASSEVFSFICLDSNLNDKKEFEVPRIKAGTTVFVGYGSRNILRQRSRDNFVTSCNPTKLSVIFVWDNVSDRVWNQPCHPFQNTSEHQQRVILLGLKDPNIPFPICPPGDAGISLLRWRMLSTDEPVVPLTINCWPSVCGGARFVSMEYEASTMFNLHNVVSKCEPELCPVHSPTFLKTPSIYVFDCSAAGMIFNDFIEVSNLE
ncbi:hypothetical protein C5167_038341 [Papaver somniferum]|uniref:Coatomer subunit delta n=1 Tax=Papaver somniferum TaxID=3469 RepID=A0A4Y7ICC7_PAPSO|nr:hypothetical protein C5167_038341 [Papaver somniferum]